MSYRVDKKLIRYLHETDPRLAQQWISLPLVYITEENRRDSAKFGREKVDKDEFPNMMWEEEWMPWDTFCIFEHIEDNSFDGHSNQIVDQGIMLRRISHGYRVFVVAITTNHAMHYIGETAPLNQNEYEWEILVSSESWTEKQTQAASDFMLFYLARTRLFFEWLYFGDHYWIEQRSSKKHPNLHGEKELRRKPWLRRDLTTMIALNRMPGEPSPESVVLGHSSKRPHQRRGHWRRLMNDRFRNHPKFGERIWIKPHWCGPQEKIHEGHTYRVFVPPNQEHNHDQTTDLDPTG